MATFSTYPLSLFYLLLGCCYFDCFSWIYYTPSACSVMKVHADCIVNIYINCWNDMGSSMFLITCVNVLCTLDVFCCFMEDMYLLLVFLYSQYFMNCRYSSLSSFSLVIQSKYSIHFHPSPPFLAMIALTLPAHLPNAYITYHITSRTAAQASSSPLLPHTWYPANTCLNMALI